MEDKGKIEELRTIYEELDNEWKERVISVVEEYLPNTDKNSQKRGKFMSQNVNTVEIVKKPSEEEINMWSILISVLKNWGHNEGSVDSQISDIEEIKRLIKFFE